MSRLSFCCLHSKWWMTQELNSEPGLFGQNAGEVPKNVPGKIPAGENSHSVPAQSDRLSASLFPTLSWSGHSFLFDVLGEVFKESFTRSSFLLHSVTLCTSFLSLLSPSLSLVLSLWMPNSASSYYSSCKPQLKCLLWPPTGPTQWNGSVPTILPCSLWVNGYLAEWVIYPGQCMMRQWHGSASVNGHGCVIIGLLLILPPPALLCFGISKIAQDL